jgi:hypothetical protein
MLILIDKKAPDEVKHKLSEYGRVVFLETSGIVYDAISGHPDIFIFQHPGGLVTAPCLPGVIKNELMKTSIPVTTGDQILGAKYPETAIYNSLYTSYGVLHNTTVSDPKILESHHEAIHCSQAYTRCNAIQVGDIIITSDKGIEKTLLQKNIPAYYVDPQGIVLHGFNNGFFGGCCGIHENKLFICGSLKHLKKGINIRKLADDENFDIIELYPGPLMDVGGIFFIE